MAERRIRLRLKAKARVPAEGEAPCKVARSEAPTTPESVAAAASVAAECSAPAPVADTAAPMDVEADAPVPAAAEQQPPETESVSDRKLQAEVQAILATDVQDLAQTTLGQVRRALEERLGLATGMLGKRKQLRRRVSRIVHEEVVRKAQRTPSCDRIVRALVEYDGLPDEVRQMLINCLPRFGPDTAFALRRSAEPVQVAPSDASSSAAPISDAAGGDSGASAPAGEPRLLHSHQVQMLRIVRDALADCRERTTNAASENLERVKVVEAEICAIKAECAAAAAVQTDAQARSDAAASRKQELEQAVVDAEREAAAAEVACAGAADEEAAVVARRDAAVALRDGPWTLLLEGRWSNIAERGAAIATVLSYMKDERADDALVLAAPATLRKKPDERSAFDKLAADSMKQLIDKRIAEADSRLAEGIQAQANSKRLATGVILKTTKTRAEQQVVEDGEARAAALAAAEARRAAEATLASRWSGTKDLCAEGDRFRYKLQELDEILAILDRWVETRHMSEPEPPANPEAAPAAAPASEDSASTAAAVEAEAAPDASTAPAVEVAAPGMSAEADTDATASMEVSLEPPADEPAPEEAAVEASEPAAEQMADVDDAGAEATSESKPEPVLPVETEASSEDLSSEAGSAERQPNSNSPDSSPTRSTASGPTSPSPAKKIELPVETPGKAPGLERHGLDGILAKCLGA